MHQPLSFSEYSTIVRTNVCINSFPELFIFPYIISNSKRKSRNFSITTISRMILNRFLRFHNQHAVSRTQEIHERHLAAVPFPFPGFPACAFHRLDQDIFPLILNVSRQRGDGKLPGIFGRINPIFRTEQVHAVILWIYYREFGTSEAFLLCFQTAALCLSSRENPGGETVRKLR